VTAEPSSSRNRIQGLEVIRGVAALTVLWGHMLLHGLLPPSVELLPKEFSTEAVICFFVLSGAVITRSRPPDLRRYARARFLRIYPTYLVALLLAVAAAAAWGDVINANQYFRNALFLQSMSGWPSPPPARDFALWSLSNEVVYYAAFALTYAWPRVTWLWAAVALAATGLSYTPLHPYGHTGAAYAYWMLALSVPWLMGCFIVQAQDRLPRISLGLGVSLSVIGLAAARSSFSIDYYDPLRLDLFACGAAALILAILQGGQGVRTANALWIKLAAAVVALAALWLTGKTPLAVRTVLSALAIAAVLAPESLPLSRLGRLPVWSVLAAVGGVSYALYAIHLPLIWLALRFPPSPLRVPLFLCALAGGSWALERSSDALRRLIAAWGRPRPALAA
jgi:peptidoglycan/LPS O-acetylase OafA/YrhL